MRQFGEILGLGLQEIREEREREAKTILEFLRERMDGADRLERRKTLAERLGWKGMACCGATWAIRSSTISIRDDEDEHEDEDVVGPLQPQQRQNQQEEEEQQIEVIDVGRIPPETNSDPGCDGEGPVVSGMNLADALAAERQFRAADLDGGSGLSPNPSPVRPNSDVTAQETPLRVSLMRLLEETDGGDGAEEVEKGEKGVGNDSVCCVCMGRKKGAAFIPCGHTFCRVCSRELWLNRGSCPLCNRPIVEILDIF